MSAADGFFFLLLLASQLPSDRLCRPARPQLWRTTVRSLSARLSARLRLRTAHWAVRSTAQPQRGEPDCWGFWFQ
ncbi:hypothetical protein EMO91_08620 [Bifidobacterium myosotis]|uniref:Uncharacterized protein n=1 Tax=Bifidobacterium myosotis TaxID=1630166 RepID=A0A5M9ZIM9_9BIFI|nr:hypothetical protein EMO91_08620 [Bifidobacterium myosotis]